MNVGILYCIGGPCSLYSVHVRYCTVLYWRSMLSVQCTCTVPYCTVLEVHALCTVYMYGNVLYCIRGLCYVHVRYCTYCIGGLCSVYVLYCILGLYGWFGLPRSGSDPSLSSQDLSPRQFSPGFGVSGSGPGSRQFGAGWIPRREPNPAPGLLAGETEFYIEPYHDSKV